MRLLSATLLVTGTLGLANCRIVDEEETKTQLTKLVERAGDMNIVDINEEVEKILARRVFSGLPAPIRHKHQEMRRLTFAAERERQLKIREVIPKLTIPAKQRLVRIIMVQEHKLLTQNEKRNRLTYIKKTMEPEVGRELAQYLTDQQLYRLAF
ncbi:unnamed protein product, partial [Mesorhabditis spiculigera]